LLIGEPSYSDGWRSFYFFKGAGDRPSFVSMVTVTEVKLPYSVADVLTQQRKLTKCFPFRTYTGSRLTEEDIQTLAIYFQWKFSRLDVPAAFFLSSLDVFRHRTIDRPTLVQFLSQMTAVLAAEEQPAHPVTPWLVQEEDEWVPVEVLAVDQKDNATYVFKCQALGSNMWGHIFDYRVSMKMAFRMASRVGFNQRDELKRMNDPLQFTDLRLVLRIAKGSTPGRVKVLDCGEHAATAAYNQKINKKRDPEFRKCPFQQKTTCFRCGKGKDQCKLAVIPKTE